MGSTVQACIMTWNKPSQAVRASWHQRCPMDLCQGHMTFHQRVPTFLK